MPTCWLKPPGNIGTPAPALRAWLQVAQDANWSNIVDLRLTYPSADGVEVSRVGS